MMSDFETRVRETLRTGSEGAPTAVGLAEAARRRWRKRRRTTAAVAATAVVIAAVPLGMAILGDGSSPAKKDDVTVANLPEIPDGWRWESWRDIQIAVPGNWENGAASQWCVSSDSNAGFVDRGEGVSTLVACSPGLSSSVSFREGIAKHPLIDIQGVGKRLTFDDNTVDIVAPDQETLDEIVASAHQFDEADSRGCAAAYDDESLLAGSFEALPDAGRLTLCRYSGVVAGDESIAFSLAESRALSDDESGALISLIAAAPEGSSGQCASTASSAGEEAGEVPWAVGAEIRNADGRVAALIAGDCIETGMQTADGDFVVGEELSELVGSQLMVIG